MVVGIYRKGKPVKRCLDHYFAECQSEKSEESWSGTAAAGVAKTLTATAWGGWGKTKTLWLSKNGDPTG